MRRRLKYVAVMLVMFMAPFLGGGRALADPTLNRYPIPTPNSQPLGIVKGPDGALWFTEGETDKIGRITTAGVITEYALPTSNRELADIINGPDGALWFVEANGDSVDGLRHIGRITTSGAITEYPLPSGVEAYYMIAGPDGALWFTYNNGSADRGGIGRMAVDGTVSLMPFPDVSSNGLPLVGAIDVTVGPDGAFWFSQPTAKSIGRMTLAGDITVFPLPASASYPAFVTPGPDGALWFIEYGDVGQNYIGRMTLDGAVTQYPLSATTGGVGFLTVGPNNDLWFSQYDNNGTYLSSMTTSGVLTEYKPYLSAYSNVNLMALGPDGALWFTQSAPDNLIGRFSPLSSPALGTPAWSLNPKSTTSSTTLTVPATDSSGTGLARAEYFLGDTDPGPGNAVAMTLTNQQVNGGVITGADLSATFGTNIQPGVYKVTVRAMNAAGNWSTTVSDYLAVYDPSSPKMTGKRSITPSLANGDSLPGLTSDSQTDDATFGFTVQYNTSGVIDPKSDARLSYATGTKCNSPSRAVNCHTFELNATSITWYTTEGPNASTGVFQGTATMTIDGVTTPVVFRITATDGSRLTPTGNDQFTLYIYDNGANPDTATPLYRVNNTSVVKGGIKIG